MNKKGQIGDWEEIIKFIIITPILIVLFVVIFAALGSVGQQNCPTCDCSQYQNQATSLTGQLALCQNQTKEIFYVNQTVEVPVEKIVYKEKFIPISLNILALIFSITITVKLFTIKLPKELEDKLRRIEKTIIFVKRISLIVSILILIRVIYILFSLF